MDTTHRGCRISGAKCNPHSVEHYSGGDDVVAADLRSGTCLLWRAWHNKTPIHDAGQAFASLEAAMTAIDKFLDDA